MLNITCIKLVIYKPDTTNLMLVELIFYIYTYLCVYFLDITRFVPLFNEVQVSPLAEILPPYP